MYVNKENLKLLSTETSGEGCDMKWNRGVHEATLLLCLELAKYLNAQYTITK